MLSKLRRKLTCGRWKESRPETENKPNEIPDEDDGSYDALSEVAAPPPVERMTEEEEARRESLDRNISRTHSQPHLSNN
ncbi:hypothetical protein N7475_000870 [Penicillium sp. IBT 31633x]|nr:hypothetical protein N7475_000870 [Penicillium sp. IBT 31633x]